MAKHTLQVLDSNAGHYEQELETPEAVFEVNKLIGQGNWIYLDGVMVEKEAVETQDLQRIRNILVSSPQIGG